MDVVSTFHMPLFSNPIVMGIRNCIFKGALAWSHESCTPEHKGPVATGPHRAAPRGTQCGRAAHALAFGV